MSKTITTEVRLAVLAYFFDSCDIFEDPIASVEAS